MAKIQVLYTIKKEGVQDNPEVIATAVGAALKAKSDKIPPAYMPENQSLVVLVFENNGKLDKSLTKLCQEITPKRSVNAAFIILSKDGSTDGGEAEALLTRNGVKIIDKLGVAVKGGFLKSGKVTDEDVKNAVAFAEKAAAAL